MVEEHKMFHYYFKSISNAVHKHRNNMMLDLGITASQSDVLSYIFFCSNSTINQRDIEKKFNLKNATVNGILARLETNGFITRTTSQSDGRIKNIELTNKSYEFKKKMLKKKEYFEKKLLEGIPKEEMKIFINVLEKMLINVTNEEEK